MIAFRNFSLRRGERLLLSDVDLALHAGYRVGVVGRNGTGKSSLFAVMMGEVKAQFRPEFVNRIDEVVVFHALGEDNIKAIARIQLNVLQARLAKMDFALEVSEAALAELAKVGFDPVYGARPLKRAIQSEIENPLARSILEGRFAPRDAIRVDWRGGRMTFEAAPAKAAA